MRKPEPPPDRESLMDTAIDGDRLLTIVRKVAEPLIDGKYLHWDNLRHRTPPDGLSTEEWWLGLKLTRSADGDIPLEGTDGQRFSYNSVQPITERLHEIDLGAGGTVQMPEQITNPETKDRYYVASLIEEAITSSQLEGAATTRMVAKELIRSGRKPSDRNERMIVNNFATMRHLAKLKNEPLTPKLVFEIHRMITEDALDDPSAAGRFRRKEEKVVVVDMYGEAYHQPPPAEQLAAKMKSMCDFANGKTPSGFVHPVLRSIALHFWLAYDHPFVDGNGRTARALFYWSMLRHGYWLFEYISISPIILKAPSQYQRAFLYTETDENDLTYFLLYHLGLIRRAMRGLHDYIKRKSEQLRRLESELRGIVALNHRQRVLVSHALRHPTQIYTVHSHRLSHNIVYETARKDLADLAKRGLLAAKKTGRTWLFSPAGDLEKRLSRLGE